MAELWFGGRIAADSESSVHDPEAILTQDGRILGIGNLAELEQHPEIRERHNLDGAVLYPGFRDPHAHFFYLGLGTFQADLRPAGSAAEALGILKKFAAQNPELCWIEGRGWNETSWPDAADQHAELLDAVFPDIPVYLTRIDGHAAWVNTEALRIAGIEKPAEIPGGSVESRAGKPSGILVDTAMDLVRRLIPADDSAKERKALIRAQQKCYDAGLVGVADLGLTLDRYRDICTLQLSGDLSIPIYGVLTPEAETEVFFRKQGPLNTGKLNLRSFKYYADGALGSRGARMLEPYSDAPETRGLWMHPPEYMRKQSRLNMDGGFQMITHAIGDAAVREVLDVYLEAGVRPENRWRIEHAQIVHPSDMDRFAGSGIWASIQSSHGVSDRQMALERIGAERVAHAYRARTLVDRGIPVVNGSDFPIELESPLRGFVAAAFRKEMDGNPASGFRPEEALSRKEALDAMTIRTAEAQFEEALRGDLSQGKMAEFTILDTDIREAPEDSVRKAQVLGTVVDGEFVYRRT